MLKKSYVYTIKACILYRIGTHVYYSSFLSHTRHCAQGGQNRVILSQKHLQPDQCMCSVPDWCMYIIIFFPSPPPSCTSQSRFENYFGGPYLELGHLLYNKLFGPIPSVDEELFVSSMTVLERLSSKRGDHHEAESFYFQVFSEGKEAIDRQGEWCVG